MEVIKAQEKETSCVPVLLVASLCFLLVCRLAEAREAGTPEAVDRSMAFVEQSMAATDLLNADKAEEALPVFQELARRDADLDADGYVAIGLGDCLARLSRLPEARQAYEAAAAAHPDRKAQIDQRLIELDLAGPIPDALLERLRQSASGSDEARFAASWHLGRALQKKARALLAEAVNAFSLACGPETVFPCTVCRTHQAALLAELSGELGSLIDALEIEWQRFHEQLARRKLDAQEPSPDDQAFLTVQADWTFRKADGQRLAVQFHRDKPDSRLQVTVGGQAVELTEDEAAAIRMHQERINRILGDAVRPAGAGERRQE